MTTLILLALTGVIAFILPVSFGATLLNIAGFFIGISGMLLDSALKYLVVEFGAQIYSPIANVLGNTIWSAFRDIANIVIIGMFTFIAVTIILGSQSFNAKKMVARVLIIAVLINFSLLFTRVIIETSNFVAGKFYSAMALNSSLDTSSSDSGGTLTGVVNFASTAGISGQFMNLLGLPSAFDTRNTLNTIYDTNGGRWSWGGITAIIYGFSAAVLMLAAAAVLAYATFLLVARTVLLLFLLVTSALAFGAYLIPKWGDRYWKMWWESLLRSAIFAPMLMLMLWTTLLLSSAIVRTPSAQSRSFDSLFSNPTDSSGILALLFFFIILGMLYGSVRFASSFSAKIVGFDWAAFIPALGVGLLSQTAAFGGRQTFGRGSLALSSSLAQRAKDAEAGSAAQRLYNFSAQRFASVAKRDFNLMQGRFGKEIQNVAKVKQIDTLAGKALGGFEGVQKEYKKQIAEQAQRLAYSDEEKKDRAKKALADEMKKDPAVKAKYEQAEREHEEAKKNLEEARKDVALAQGNIESRYKASVKGLEDNLSRAEKELADNPTDPSRVTAAQAARRALKDEVGKQQAEMRIQTDRIKRAKASVERTTQSFEDVSVAIGETAQSAGKLPKAFKSAGDIAEKLVKSDYTSVLRATYPTPQGVDKLAKGAGKEAGKTKEDKKEMLNLIRNIARDKLSEEKKDKK